MVNSKFYRNNFEYSSKYANDPEMLDTNGKAEF